MTLRYTEKELGDIATKLLNYAGSQKIFLLEGPMGCGKTTLIKHLCNSLGVVDVVNSPTFSLINEYKMVNGQTIYHFDCYRINRLSEAISLDLEDYFTSGCYCFIEWSSKIEPILPLDRLLIAIKIEASTIRQLVCSSY
ncbi:tRNA (adenosine(37)-N6)-threonylcarbamoyltransferase complex ATPase subunit type 1 TsaE [Cardinium endosymbiont of Tipula unca]|uniref:tRNA (adenosine(37)-N6)-threonylcarbamoyltransferase complex ATPase subunit type 1 TsaE n=1 Tax=Cardinium endosymbiont of Tipula unca TaxID=3066216 RepID=UPI0030CB9321